MLAEKVYESCGNEVFIRSVWDKPREDQMRGSAAEQLMEVCGRGCYDSMGTGRGSGDYHKNLLFTQKHYSVAEHFHFTIELHKEQKSPLCWLGIPDCSLGLGKTGELRLTCNLRHVLEWPSNVTFADPVTHPFWQAEVKRWQNILTWAAWEKCPNVFPKPEVSCTPDFRFVESERDTEAFVSLFLEDSLIWSHEQVRHRGNM